ncbi:MAG TPA: nucleoside triphosphate pyrophosphatase [Gammaproteobacteria bacterium]|nr:nucleoside triphosphate pyrophosphatase [Gammaproteobacteria bacterium]
MRLVLASTSPYRRDLLARLGIRFDAVAPGVDESSLPAEKPQDLVTRLAIAKAEAGGDGDPDRVVIGSDQLANMDGQLLGKPGTTAAALSQLQAMAGQEIVYSTAVAVHRAGRECRVHLDTSRVRLRRLEPGEIERYVAAEQPLDCAGALKLEGLGISLCESIETHDPTALIGLPLIATARLLRDQGFPIP